MSVSQSPFVFVIPVRNPDDEKVQNYGTIELLLKKTIESLCKQKNGSVHVIVVCHRIPDFIDQLSENVTFLDVNNISVFRSGRNPVRVDKGLKYIIGILYAAQYFRPRFIMPMDADDYIHIDLVNYIRSHEHVYDDKADGYLIQRGVHALLDVKQGAEIRLQRAYHIRNFNLTCGSCRIFNFSHLMAKLSKNYPELDNQFSDWPQRDTNKRIAVPDKPVQWLDSITREQYNNETSLVNALGRHMNQRLNFKFIPLDFVGAAKGCGHGNHDGPLGGDVHEDKIIGIYPLHKFLDDYGLAGIASPSDKPATFRDNLRFLKYYLLNRPRYLASLAKKYLTNTYIY